MTKRIPLEPLLFVTVITFGAGTVPEGYAGETSDVSGRVEAIYSNERLVKIPGGEFVFGTGSPIREPFYSDEILERTESVPEFWLSETEVSQGQWQRCVDANRCQPLRDNGLMDERLPARGMSHGEAIRYVEWLNSFDGRTSFRLPTEIEWEYAAKAGQPQSYWHQRISDSLDEVVADKVRRDLAPALRAPSALRPTKSRRSNAFGLFDMLGNVSELTSGCWQSAKEAREIRLNQAETSSCNLCVARGGNHQMSGQFARPTMRFLQYCDGTAMQTGFRIAASNDPAMP